MNATNPKHRSAGPLLVLLAVFVFPIGGTLLLSYFPDLIPQGRTNHGELLQPPPQFPEVQLKDNRGQALTAPVLREAWHLLWLSRGQCGEQCAGLPAVMARIQAALGKDAHRLKLAVVAANTPPVANESGLLALQVGAAGWPQLLSTLQTPPSGDALYLIDPMGHVVLRYAVDAPAQGILKDVERLLKYSWVG